MFRILAFTTDSTFQDRLKNSADERPLEIVVRDEVEAVVDRLDGEAFDAVLVDDSITSLSDDDRTQLVSSGSHMIPVFAVGTAAFDDLPDHAFLGDASRLDEALDNLADQLVQLRALTERPDSGAYFPSDTQGRPYLEQSDGLDRHTSQFETDEEASRLMYVGRPSEFRRHLEQAAGQEVELLCFDSPRQVTVSAGAPPIDLVVLSVEGDLRTTRRLIRYLRRRQPEAPFELILLAEPDEGMDDGLARTLGADLVVERPVEPAELIERAHMRQTGESTKLLVIASPARQDFFRTALRREPVEAHFVADVAEVEAANAEPSEIVLIDAVDGGIDAVAAIDRLRQLHPFASTRYLASLEADEGAPAAARDAFDGVFASPVLPSDIRQLVRLHLAHATMGRAALERDQLTGVNSILALGDHLQALLDQTAQTGELVVLTAVDVDNLGELNYRFGKIVGDAVLRSLADALHLATGRREAIYRTDADEFFVVQRIEEGDWLETRDCLDRALHVFRQQTFRAVDGRGTYATASAGCVVVPPVGASAEYCLKKSWIVLGRASSTRQERLLVAQLDPAAVPSPVRSRDVSDPRD